MQWPLEQTDLWGSLVDEIFLIQAIKIRYVKFFALIALFV